MYKGQLSITPIQEVPMRMIELDSLLAHLVKHGADDNGHRQLH